MGKFLLNKKQLNYEEVQEFIELSKSKGLVISNIDFAIDREKVKVGSIFQRDFRGSKLPYMVNKIKEDSIIFKGIYHLDSVRCPYHELPESNFTFDGADFITNYLDIIFGTEVFAGDTFVIKCLEFFKSGMFEKDSTYYVKIIKATEEGVYVDVVDESDELHERELITYKQLLGGFKIEEITEEEYDAVKEGYIYIK